MELTKKAAEKALSEFFGKNPSPLVVFGTGTSCAIDWQFGMAKLSEELQAKVPGYIIGDKLANAEWANVVEELNKGVDLENAMNHAISHKLVESVVMISGHLVSRLDKEYCNKIINGEKEWLPISLIKRMVDNLSTNDRALHVVTPNYDMLAEYAFESKRIPYINGFNGNVVRDYNWEQSRHSMKFEKVQRLNGKKKVSETRALKHIELFKVHGSINTFYVKNKMIENNLWSWNPPEFAERIMVTPGTSKFEKLAHFREELFQPFDSIIKKKDSFLFIGYGFNDSHIEKYLRPKLTEQKCQGIIITRDSNPRIEALMKDAGNLWLVCKDEKPDKEGTRIWNSQYDNWIYIENKQLWNIKEFTTELIGD